MALGAAGLLRHLQIVRAWTRTASGQEKGTRDVTGCGPWWGIALAVDTNTWQTWLRGCADG